MNKRRHDFVSTQNIAHAAQALAAIALPAAADAAIVGAYHPIGAEIDPRPLIDGLVARGVTIALPHVTQARGSLRFLVWQPGTPLAPGPFGLRQPPADAPEVRPDVIFAPLLGFDRALNRIGHGAGHYDRAFALHSGARRIGLAWSIQACDPLPIDPWDIPLHAVATEREWIEP